MRDYLSQIGAQTKHLMVVGAAGIASVVAVAAFPLTAHAAGTVVVTPAHNDGWATADTNAGGSVQYFNDPSSPAPDGALMLTTDGTNSAKAQYMHTANTALKDVTTLSYATRQISASSASGDPSYQLVVCLAGVNNGTCGGFTTLVYEPYWNGTVIPNQWQTWDAAAGQWWSSKTTGDTAGGGTTCSVTAGSGGAPFYHLADLATNCPNAQVVGFGVNVGTYNPNYVVESDLVTFNDWVYDFQLTNAPTDKDQCKGGGFNTMTDATGNGFKNQGDCVSYITSNKDQHMHTAAVQVTNQNNSALYNQNQ